MLWLCACAGDDKVLATRPPQDASVVTDSGGPDKPAPDSAVAADGGGGIATATCEPSVTSESKCGDGIDDDCDGFIDCLDTDCEKKSCGSGELTCTAGACLQPSDGLPTLKRIDNVRVTQHGDTSIIEFEPVADALDYRIYPLPAKGDVLTGKDGELVVKNAIYRCAGARPMTLRKDDAATAYDASLSGGANLLHNYERQADAAVLGYVYLTPGAGRSPVYRVADPKGGGGYLNAVWVAPLTSEDNSAEYVIGTDKRDKLLAMGFRDDGIAFYAPSSDTSGTQLVYRKQYVKQWNGDYLTFYFTKGAEYDARAMDMPADVVDFGERFSVLTEQKPDSVALHRVLYNGNNSFDVLAAGEPRFKRVLEQGNSPVWALAWPGLTKDTTLVIEALDQGCPFPGGYIASMSAPADDFNYPSLTLDQARLSTGEVFINGEYDPANRPKPIARAYVDVSPQPHPKMDWFKGFDVSDAWEPFDITSGNNGVYIYRNKNWAIDFSGCSPNLTIGPMLGQLAVGFADFGSSCNMSMVPLDVETKIADDSFMHVRMAAPVPSTGRRYPQLMITTAKVLNPGDVQPLDSVPLHARLGPLSFQTDAPPGTDQSIVVQPFGGFNQLEVEFCDKRGWGVNEQCPQANIFGHHAGNYTETWMEPWLAIPPLGDLAGYDRPVQLDVYASTKRIYVFVDDRPAGCADFPAGHMPAGPVNVAFRAVLYHSGIDESVVPDDSPQQYLKRYSLSHFDRMMDDFGIDKSVPAPAWDEDTMPCGTRWY